MRDSADRYESPQYRTPGDLAMNDQPTVRTLLKLIKEAHLSLRDKETVARCILRAQTNRSSDELDLTRLTRDESAALERILTQSSLVHSS